MAGHYLMFKRNCADALKMYEEAFETKTTMLEKYGSMPPNPNFPVPESDKELILHSRIVIDGGEIMCADTGRDVIEGSNMYISITSGEESVKKAWNILLEGANVHMELAPSFFAKLHGSLKDKYGVNWMFTAM